jgi:hypothetical protein
MHDAMTVGVVGEKSNVYDPLQNLERSRYKGPRALGKQRGVQYNVWRPAFIKYVFFFSTKK